MPHNLKKIYIFVFLSLDDIHINSEDNKRNENSVNFVFERFHKYSLKNNISKSAFAFLEIEFFGYLITPEGSHRFSEKIQAQITNYQKPFMI